ncbi:MAG: tRNA-guanine transglycosylase, partial [Treponema sp.]|nr:tRNA-guanine transglycosylase [Treponema sp.]
MIERFFEIRHRDSGSNARTGTMHLPHGDVSTPVFMPVGTKGTVKAVSKDDLEEIGFEIILANTYHMYLRPGPEIVQEGGGLHGFTKWNRNFLT